MAEKTINILSDQLLKIMEGVKEQRAREVTQIDNPELHDQAIDCVADIDLISMHLDKAHELLKLYHF